MSQFHSFQTHPAPQGGQELEPSSMGVHQLNATYSHNANKISQTEQQLQDIINWRSASRTSRKMSSPELDLKDRHILQLQQKLEEQKRQLELQQERIRQQQATIKVQSETIQNPKTPHRREEARYPSTALTYQQPPPAYHLPSSAGQIREPLKSIYSSSNQHGGFNNGSPFGSTAQSGQEHRTASPFPPGTDGSYSTRFTPNHAMSRITNEHNSPHATNPQSGFQAVDHSCNSSSTGSFRPTPDSTEKKEWQNSMSSTSSMVIVKNPDAPNVTVITQKFKYVFSMAERYAWSHVNTPSTVGDQALPVAIKDRLIRAATSSTAYYIMSSAQTRYFLVAKIIIQWIIKHILKVSTYKDFNQDIDAKIESAKGQIFQSTPPQVRYLYLSTIANEMRRLRAEPNFETFLHSLCRNRGNQLWAIIKPLMHKKSAKDWDDLLQLMYEAHQLTDMMFSGPDEYRLEFPNTGQLFQESTMNNRDPFVNGATNSHLQANGALVRLGISPYITVRTNGPEGGSSAQNILQSDVLVKKAEQ